MSDSGASLNPKMKNMYKTSVLSSDRIIPDKRKWKVYQPSMQPFHGKLRLGKSKPNDDPTHTIEVKPVYMS